jgi:hypothetical protein
VAGEFVAAEGLMLDYVKAPGPKDIAKFNALRTEFQNVVKKLEARVKRKA